MIPIPVTRHGAASPPLPVDGKLTEGLMRHRFGQLGPGQGEVMARGAPAGRGQSTRHAAVPSLQAAYSRTLSKATTVLVRELSRSGRKPGAARGGMRPRPRSSSVLRGRTLQNPPHRVEGSLGGPGLEQPVIDQPVGLTMSVWLPWRRRKNRAVPRASGVNGKIATTAASLRQKSIQAQAAGPTSPMP